MSLFNLFIHFRFSNQYCMDIQYLKIYAKWIYTFFESCDHFVISIRLMKIIYHKINHLNKFADIHWIAIVHWNFKNRLIVCKRFEIICCVEQYVLIRFSRFLCIVFWIKTKENMKIVEDVIQKEFQKFFSSTCGNNKPI